MSTPQAQQPPQRFEEEEPPFPEKPDCCLGGCAVCVLDGYTEEVEAWEKRVSEIRARRAAREQQQQQQEQQ